MLFTILAFFQHLWVLFLNLMMPNSHKPNKVRILKDPFQDCKTFFYNFFRGVFTWQSLCPPSPLKWTSSRTLFNILTVFQHLCVQLLSDDPQESEVHQSEDPPGSFSPFLHFFTIFSEEFSADDPQEPQVQQTVDPQGSLSSFWHFFNIDESSFHLLIPKSRKSNAVRILKDPFHHCDTFLSFFSGVLMWCSPTPPPPTQQGSSRVLLTLLHPFPVDSLSYDTQDPQVQSSEYHPQGYFSPFWHFFAPFQSRSYLMIQKIPKFNQVRILKDPFTILTLFLLILSETRN